MHTSPNRSLPVLLALAMGLSPLLHAQQLQESDGLEEVIVTARKREESLQDAPVSITAFSNEQLVARNVQTVADLDNYTPNLRFNYTAPISANSATAAIFIRGIGQNDYQMSADPGVGLYLDGVYVSRGVGGVLDTVEIERTEVLRGPQGTLFGRNTIGGAINIVSKKPEHEFGGHVDVTAGTDDLVETRGHVNVPVTDSFRTSATINYRSRDAYVDNLGTGPDLGGEDRLSGRFSALFEPHDGLSLHFIADGTRIREESAPFVLVQQFETGLIPSVWNQLFSGNPAVCADPSNPARLDDPNCASPRWAVGKGQTAATFRTRDPDAVINFLSDRGRPYESAGDVDVHGFSGTADWEINESYSVKSISAYRKVKGFWSRDLDHSPLDVIGTVNDWTQDQFTQEFQLLGAASDERLRWVLGAYYSSEQGVHNDWGFLWASNLVFKSGADIDASTLAFFGQAIWSITDRWTLTVGNRWTRDRKTFNADQYVVVDNVFGFPPGTPLLPVESRMIDDRAWTPMASLSFSPVDELTLYASYAEGFKGGGFTQRVFPPLPVIPDFAPEQVKAYELGAKFEGFGNRLRVNVAGFYTDYSDLQLLGQEPTLGFAPVIFNAAQSTITGFEIDLSAIPADDWLVEGGLGYLDAGYDKVSPFAQSVGVDTSKQFVNAPELSANLGIAYRYGAGTWGTFTPRIDWIYSSEIYNDVTNADIVAQEAYHLVNASVTWESPDELWRASLAGINLGDVEYKDSGNLDPGSGIAEVVFTRGLEVRFGVSRRF